MNQLIKSARVFEGEEFFDDSYVTVIFEDHTSCRLFEFYADEISFSESDFIGKTEEEAHQLKTKKAATCLQV